MLFFRSFAEDPMFLVVMLACGCAVFVLLLAKIASGLANPTKLCRACRMRIPRAARVCHYCRLKMD